MDRIKLLALTVALLASIFVFSAAALAQNFNSDTNYGECTYGGTSCPQDFAFERTGDLEESGGDSLLERLRRVFASPIGAFETLLLNMPAWQRALLPFVAWLLLVAAGLFMLILAFAYKRKASNYKKAIELLKRKIAQQKNLVRLVTHNLNTPLAVLKSGVDLIRKTPSPQKESLATLEPATKTLELTLGSVSSQIADSSDAELPSFASPVITLREQLMNWKILLSVFLMLIINVYINLALRRVGDSQSLMALFAQLSLAVASVWVLLISSKSLKVSKFTEEALLKAKQVTEKIYADRAKIINNLAGMLGDTVNVIKSSVNKITDQKVKKMMGDAESDLRNLAVRIDAIDHRLSKEAKLVKVDALITEFIARYHDESTERRVGYKSNYQVHNDVLLYEGELRLALDTVIGNAVENAKESSSVEISTRVEGKNLVINVNDSGKVVSENDLQNAFQPISKEGDVLTGNQGLGLSLYASRVALNRIGGSIDLHSVKSGGVLATVRLPILG